MTDGCADEGEETDPALGRPPAESRVDDVEPVRADVGDVCRDLLLPVLREETVV